LIEVIEKLKERLGQASPSTPETGVRMEGFACQSRSFEIASLNLAFRNCFGFRYSDFEFGLRAKPVSPAGFMQDIHIDIFVVTHRFRSP
jgi:hypothetical protein